MLFERGDQDLGLYQEDACIPQMGALQQQLLGAFGIGLLDEGSHRMARVLAHLATEFIALADITVGRAGKRRLDAKVTM